MASIKGETKPSENLKLTRSGNKITCTWKIGDKDYAAGQQFSFLQRTFNPQKSIWEKSDVSVKAKSNTVTLDLAKYYPRTKVVLAAVAFRVRGRRDPYTRDGVFIIPDWSIWREEGANIAPPNRPSGTITVNKNNPNTTSFSWNTTTSNDKFSFFSDTEYGIDVDGVESTGTGGASGSVSKTVPTSTLYAKNTNVIFRVRSRGAGGASEWRTLTHKYIINKTTTKAPSGLAITRSGNKITISWKCADANYGQGQQLQYRFSNMKADTWHSVEVNSTTTTKTITIPVVDYYPNKSTYLNSITFRVRGMRSNYLVHNTSKSTSTVAVTDVNKPSWSAWSTKTFDLATPNVPEITTEWDAEHNNVTLFSWTTKTATTGAQHYTNVELQTIRVKECNETDGSKLSWKSTTDGWATAVYSANDSREITEDSTILANSSYTRWVRVRARGARGASAWSYAKHVYGKPYRAKVKSAEATTTKAMGYICKMKWETAQNAAHPIDVTKVEYAFATPLANMVCPAGASWQEVESMRDTGGLDGANFEVDNRVELDQCLYLRVNTEHDDNVNHGEPQRVATGNLKDPQNISADIPASGYTATVTATNTSTVSDSFLVVLYRRKKKDDLIVGVIPHGQTSTTVTCPNWSSETNFSFGVYAAQGRYERVTRADSVTQYKITANARSVGTIWTNENVPKAPETVELEETDGNGSIMVSWDWAWSTATSAEITWSDDKNAWQSTAGFKSYKIQSRAGKWYIPKLEMGKRWYVRVRLYEEEEAGPWSKTAWIDLATTPATPMLTLSEGRIKRAGRFTCSWTYTSRDNMPQAFAEIQECTINGETITAGRTIARTESSQAIVLYPEMLKWQAGSTHNLRVRVTSSSNKKSAWSDPVTINVASPLTCVIDNTSLEEITIVDDVEQGITRDVIALTEMPLSFIVTGAGEGGTTSAYIERDESYHMIKPDESDFNGYEGETIAVVSQPGEAEIVITTDELIGTLDDGAKYRIVAVVSDDLGQVARAILPFEVWWEHKAEVPSAEIEVDTNSRIAKITPIAPEGYEQGDTCDVYRLSADKPELIITDGLFGITYVDPYPALNEHGGHRIVFKTANGDYITDDNNPAWVDYHSPDGDVLNLSFVIIDFDGEQISLPYNIDITSTWAKDFTETKYLGGSIQGDWNKAVSRTASIGTTSIAIEDPELIKSMRRLAAYPGICHVRTPEGSSYAADVQVSETMSYETSGKLAEFSLSVTRVDAEGLDGVTLEEWEVEQ